jgi:hypothetical protein
MYQNLELREKENPLDIISFKGKGKGGQGIILKKVT